MTMSDQGAEIPIPATKTEMRDFAREEFERFRHVDDIVSIRGSIRYNRAGFAEVFVIQGHIRYLVSVSFFQAWTSIGLT